MGILEMAEFPKRVDGGTWMVQIWECLHLCALQVP